jgi:hypothetical protein
MKLFKLAALIGLLALSACKKNGGGTPSVIGKDHILTSFRVVSSKGDNTYQFNFDANDRPVMVRNLQQGTITVGASVFFYNDQGQLESSVSYKGEPTGTPHETTEFHYNAEGQLISDNTFDASGNDCYQCNHEYDYDEEGRLSEFKGFNAFYRRFEYDDDGNPIKSYFRALNETTETLEFEYLKYDKLAPYFGVDSTMRIILRSMFWSSVYWPSQNPWTNVGEFPLPAMANNITKMRWNPRPHPQSVSLKRELTAQLEYNADGYPVKGIVKFSKQFEGSDPEEWTVYLTYKKLD